jgi:LPXTG-motif cell wall-anchored protein
MIRIENYYEGVLKIDGEEFLTTKGDDLYHGYGIKSIRYTANRYDGAVYINAENNWFGTFSGLPYYQEDGITPIVYTIVEEPFKDYVPEYSEAVPTSDPLANWSEVRDLTPGGIYRFVSEGLALSCGSDGSLIAAVDNVEDISQWWRAASIDDCWILTNLATEKSISFIGGTFTTANSGVILGFSHGLIFNMPIEGDTNYLRMSAEAVEATASSKEATVFTVYQKASVDKVPIYNILLINHENPSYELPDTGGIGFEIFTLGGSLLMAAAFVCILAQRKKDSTV